MVTIKDIAKESGYAVSTVSRVLNNHPDVSGEAKEKIEEIVKLHGFVPNNNAKHLKQTVSKTICILVKGTNNSLFSTIIEKTDQLINQTDFTAMIEYLDEDLDEVKEAVKLCYERKPQGFIFLGGNPSSFEDNFANINVPSVLVTNSADELQFDNLSSVSTDDFAGAYYAITHLINNGHRKIGIIGGNLEKSQISITRYSGCLKAFEENKIVFDKNTNYQKARFSFEKAYQATKILIEKSPDITAIFAMSDVMAIGTIRALCDLNLKVPDDISVIGYDGIDLANFYNPKITTINQLKNELATQSVNLLLKLINSGGKAVHEMLPFNLISGESVKKI